MKSAKTYIPCVLISIILVFSMLGTGICIIADKVILNPDTCIKIIDEKDLDSKVKNLIDKTFREKYNSTGIPPEVYTDVISEQWINTSLKMNIISGFEYLNGIAYTFSVSPDLDFKELDESITNFFNTYADKNGYVKDSSYYDKLQKEIDAAHRIIINYTDIFKFNTLDEHGVFSQARRYINYLDKIMYICIGADILCIVLIFLLCKKNIKEILYWVGSSFIVSSVIVLVPCVYLTSSNYFDSFVIKQEQIFTAFTSYMYRIIDSFTAFEIGVLAAGFLMTVIYIITCRKRDGQ